MGNPRYSNGHRRRRLRARVLATETWCGICGGKVDKTLPPNDPGAPEVDEILPVSLGGDPLKRSNVQLAHRICNQRKGNRIAPAGETSTPIAPPQPATSRLW